MFHTVLTAFVVLQRIKNIKQIQYFVFTIFTIFTCFGVKNSLLIGSYTNCTITTIFTIL